MARWLVAMEAMIYEEVEAPSAAEATAQAMEPYEDLPVEITCIVDVDIMTDEDDTTPRDRIREEMEGWL